MPMTHDLAASGNVPVNYVLNGTGAQLEMPCDCINVRYWHKRLLYLLTKEHPNDSVLL
jgi:hypothetical protein